MTLFTELPDEARLWIFAADRPLSDAESQTLLETLAPFLEGWTAHGLPVRGQATVLHRRFLLLAGHVPGGEISGCSIDAATRAVEAAAREVGITWISPLAVFYRDADGTVQRATRGQFRRLIAEGKVTAETPVFDLSLTTVGDLRRGAFEKPAGRSWHARVFALTPQL
ncbi:hypothetical protein [Rhodothermus marinus]|uniref:hypothetical protein n=1 Tax=Rhodothermus marinus TaxID=29549 RepID=UPI001D591C6D|nr:hypothetical protein [Rhodothermus marinus]MBO2490572.1 hypothetical protein [Rhodothermus marinus]